MLSPVSHLTTLSPSRRAITQAVAELRRLFQLLRALETPARVFVGLSTRARRAGIHDQHGVIFRAVSEGSTVFGAAGDDNEDDLEWGAGGRYDDLLNHYALLAPAQVGAGVPAYSQLCGVGVVVNVDRLAARVQTLRQEVKEVTAQTPHTIRKLSGCLLLSPRGDLLRDRLRLASQLWGRKVRAEIRVPAGVTDKSVRKYCFESGIRYLVTFAGSDKKPSNTVHVEDVRATIVQSSRKSANRSSAGGSAQDAEVTLDVNDLVSWLVDRTVPLVRKHKDFDLIAPGGSASEHKTGSGGLGGGAGAGSSTSAAPSGSSAFAVQLVDPNGSFKTYNNKSRALQTVIKSLAPVLAAVPQNVYLCYAVELPLSIIRPLITRFQRMHTNQTVQEAGANEMYTEANINMRVHRQVATSLMATLVDYVVNHPTSDVKFIYIFSLTDRKADFLGL